jgi:hypothetical protein
MGADLFFSWDADRRWSARILFLTKRGPAPVRQPDAPRGPKRSDSQSLLVQNGKRVEARRLTGGQP